MLYILRANTVYTLYIRKGGIMAASQIVKWGNSLAVRIPKTVAEEAGVREGDPITIEAKGGRIQLRRGEAAVPSLEELAAQITKENRYDAVRTGAERGRERVEW